MKTAFVNAKVYVEAGHFEEAVLVAASIDDIVAKGHKSLEDHPDIEAIHGMRWNYTDFTVVWSQFRENDLAELKRAIWLTWCCLTTIFSLKMHISFAITGSL